MVVEKLNKLQSTVNHLKELIVLKAFNSSSNISKACEFINQLNAQHEEFCQRFRLFAQEQADMLT